MLTSKLKLATALLIAAGAVAAGSGALLGRPAADPPKPDPVPAAKPGAGLPADWSRTVGPDPLTDGAGQVLSAGSKVTLRVEQGWLVVRRETAGGELEWQVVLARADDPRPPQVRLDKGAFTLDIRYGSFFIRESGGLLRVLRERKADQSPPWSRLPLDANRRSMGWAGSGDPTRVAGWEVGDWCWATVGPADDRADVLVRLHHKELLGKGHGFTSIANALAKMDAGPKYVQDEGDLLIADRTRPEVAVWMLQAKKVRQEIGTKPAPALAARRWFNAPDGLELDKLRGKVVLLDFWGTWCGPCVQKLPRTEELHQKYKDRGLVVIGVHSAQDGDKVADFLKAKGFTFPVAIDQGGTAKQYAIEAWPTYFLIDKSGKVAWGFEHEPPPEGRIEELLR
jgi:thiol-disulfide isomerase/thioredoxin